MKHKLFFTCLICSLFIIIHAALNRGITIHNPIRDMTSTILNEISPYGTDYVYSESITVNADPIILEEGVNGLNYTYDGLNYKHLADTKNEVVQKGTAKEGVYTGKLTGYGPDCPGCSKVGNVSCKTREGVNHSLINDGIYYNDITYGNVRILAAENSLFPCGTIVKINNGVLKEFYGIVLDTGYSMRNAYKDGIIWMDLAFQSQEVAKTGGATSSSTTFVVQRWGW